MKMSKEARKIITAAFAMIDRKGTWTKGTEARDKNGNPCDVYRRDVHSRCIDGALMTAARLGFGRKLGARKRALEQAREIVRKAIRLHASPKWLREIDLLGVCIITNWNDVRGRTHVQVCALGRFILRPN